MTATKAEAAKVIADLTAKAKAEPDTRQGRRAKQLWYTAASAIEMAYGIGTLNLGGPK